MRVMIVGASTDTRKFGNKAVRAYLRDGHEVLPVNPNAETVEGLRCYTSVEDPPGPIDRASFYVPPEIGVTLMTKLAGRGDVGELWLNPGAESEEAVLGAREAGFDPIIACSIVAIGEDPT